MVNDSPRFSRTVRSMLELRDSLGTYIRCGIGDGCTASFWFDYWTELGPLFSLFGSSGPRHLRIPLQATMADAFQNGFWFLPPARSDFAETLQIILSTITPPSASNGSDVFLWRGAPTGCFTNSFSSKVTWEILREPSPVVPWFSTIWFKEEIPRCSFVAWLSMLGRLPTRDRLLSWGLSVPSGCVLCSNGVESHRHLFFECSFAAGVWLCFCGRFMSNPPSDLLSAVVFCEHLQGPHAVSAKKVFKLLLQVIIYNLWRERNALIFRGSALHPSAFFRVIDRAMRDRLLSFPSVTASSPSLLELYLCFISPFS